MTVRKVSVAETGRVKFLKITKTFEIECREEDGEDVRLRLPLQALFDLLDAAEGAEAKKHLGEDDFNREGPPVIVPRALELMPIGDSDLSMTFELKSGKKVMFQLLSQASSDTRNEAARLIAEGLNLATASLRN